MNRKLIHEDKKKLELICQDLDEYKPYLDRLQEKYENLDMGGFSEAVFNEIKYNPDAIKEKYDEGVKKELKSAGIKTTSISESLIKESQKAYEEFYESVNELLSFMPTRYSLQKHPRLELNYISFKSEEFKIQKRDQEEILETFCRIYLETPEEKNIYQKLELFLQAHEDLKEALHEVDYELGDTLSGVEHNLISFKSGKAEIKPSMISHACNYAEMKKRVNRRISRAVNGS